MANCSGQIEFDQLYLHHRRVYGICFRILRNVDDAQEAMQDVFLKAFVHLERFVDRDISALLNTMARNQAIDHLRKRTRVEMVSLQEPVRQGDGMQEDITISDMLPSQDLSPETQAFFSELMQAVDELPPVQRDSMLLMLQGYTQVEIAQMLGVISAITIWQRLSRARTSLKQATGYRRQARGTYKR